MLKKIIAAVLISLTCLVLVAGCGGAPAGNAGDNGGAQNGSASSSDFTKPANPLDLDFESIDWAAQPEVRLLWTIAQGANSSGGVNITVTMEDAEEKTGGKLQYELSPDAVLVDEAGMLEALESGLCQVVKQTPSVNVGMIPEVECLVYPGFFNGSAEEYANFLVDIRQPVNDIYADHGYMVFAPSYTGVSAFLTKRMQVTKPEDLEGMLLRASGASLSRVIESYGAASTVLGLGDVPSALDRATIDGLFSSCAMMIDLHFTEVAPYLTVLTFREMLGDYAMSTEWYNGLTPEMQAVIDYYGAKYIEVCKERVDQLELDKIEESRQNGINVLVLDAEQSAPFADAVLPMFEEFGRNTSDKGRALLRVIYDYNDWEWNF